MTVLGDSVTEKKIVSLSAFILATIYGAALIWLVQIFMDFVFKAGPIIAIHALGLGFTLFAAVSLYPILAKVGRCKSTEELRKELTNSFATISQLESRSKELEKTIEFNQANIGLTNQRFQLVLGTFDISTFYCDLDHVYTWAHNTCMGDGIVGKTDEQIFETEIARKMRLQKDRAIENLETTEQKISLKYDDETIHHFLVRCAPLINDVTGKVTGSISVSVDVTYNEFRKQKLEMLLREVNHRSRNLLSIISALLQFSSANATSISDFKQKISGRVRSLAKSMDLITRDEWTVSSLRQVIDSQISDLPVSMKRNIEASGCNIEVGPKVIQNIGLAIHELVSNSKLHGALSESDGKVKISWHTEGEQSDSMRLIFNWHEVSSKAVVEPTELGFGLRALDRILAQDLGGESVIEWKGHGIACRFDLPLNKLRASLNLTHFSSQTVA